METKQEEFPISESYKKWADENESHVHGGGFGHKHKWHYEGTPSNTSYYKCALCYQNFAHAYNHTPDIFEAIKKSGVTEDCPGHPVQKLRNW